MIKSSYNNGFSVDCYDILLPSFKLELLRLETQRKDSQERTATTIETVEEEDSSRRGVVTLRRCPSGTQRSSVSNSNT